MPRHALVEFAVRAAPWRAILRLLPDGIGRADRRRDGWPRANLAGEDRPASVAVVPRNRPATQTLRRSPHRHLCGEFFQSLWIFAKPRRDIGRRAQPPIALQKYRRSRRRQCRSSLWSMKCELRHPMYHRPFVNRDVTQSQRTYRRGWDAYIPYQR